MFPADLLAAYVEAGLLTADPHPRVPGVVLYNYTPKCSRLKAWDAVTTRCRGLVIDWSDGGRVLANPFPKIFDVTSIARDAEKPVITPKLDGWLGIIFKLRERWEITTRGRWNTRITPWAQLFLAAQVDLAALRDDHTYLVEMVHPLTRVVIDYGFEGMVLLAARHTATGREDPNVPRPAGLRRLPPLPAHDDWRRLLGADRRGEEGYVLHWPRHDLRGRVKFPSYLRALRAKGVPA